MSSNGKMVCVTGASGFVASWLVKLLLIRGYTVKASVRDPADPKRTEHLRLLDGAKERLQLYKADLLEENSFDAIVDGCEGVFHTATPVFFTAKDPEAELIEPAIKGTLNVLSSCSRSPTVKRVIVTSSIAACKFNGTPLTSDVVVDESWFSCPKFCRENKMGRVRMTASERKRRTGKGAEGTSADKNDNRAEGDTTEYEIDTRQVEEQQEEEDVGDEEHGDGSDSSREDEDEDEDEDDTGAETETGQDDEEEAEDEEAVNEKGGPKITDVIREFDTHVAYLIWTGQERPLLTCVNHAQKASEWRIPDNATRFKAIIDLSGLSSIVSTCYKSVNRNLISAFVERWYPETNTFHLPFGEMTITFDDVASLLHIPVEGKPIQSNSYEMEQAVSIVSKYLGLSKAQARLEMNERVGYKLSLSTLHGIFEDVSDEWTDRAIRRAARAYLLFLVGNTLFADKSKSHVHISLLDPLKNLDIVNTYSWGSATLAFLYRQLGLATRMGVKQIAGFLCLLESWIFEHFPCFHPSTNLYYESLPRAARWNPSTDCGASVIDLRIFLDTIQIEQVIFDPYVFARHYHPFHAISWYSGCILFLNVVEPYHPDRVLRQFGRVQNIPTAPIPPVATTARRGSTSTTYTRVRYQFLESIWDNWYNHVIAEGRRSIPLNQSMLSCTDEYTEWYRDHSVLRVHNPVYLPADVRVGASHFQPTYNQLYSTLHDVHGLLNEANPQLDSVRAAVVRYIRHQV